MPEPGGPTEPSSPGEPDVFNEISGAKKHFGFYLFICAFLSVVSMLAASVAGTAIRGSPAKVWQPLGMGFLVGAGAFMVAGLLGLIFGIPRSVASPEGRAYLDNTNLEQISDWLTKILVGFGLAQAGSVVSGLNDIGNRLGPGFSGSRGGGDLIVMALIAVNVPCGFYFFYVWSRLYLPLLLDLSEYVAAQRKRNQAGG